MTCVFQEATEESCTGWAKKNSGNNIGIRQNGVGFWTLPLISFLIRATVSSIEWEQQYMPCNAVEKLKKKTMEVMCPSQCWTHKDTQCVTAIQTGVCL